MPDVRVQRASLGAPNDASIFMSLALTDCRQGLWTDALTHIQAAAALDPNNALVAIKQREMLHSLRRYPEAVVVADRWIASRPAFFFRLAKSETTLAWKADPALARAELASVPASYGPVGGRTLDQLTYDCCARLRRRRARSRRLPVRRDLRRYRLYWCRLDFSQLPRRLARPVSRRPGGRHERVVVGPRRLGCGGACPARAIRGLSSFWPRSMRPSAIERKPWRKAAAPSPCARRNAMASDGPLLAAGLARARLDRRTRRGDSHLTSPRRQTQRSYLRLPEAASGLGRAARRPTLRGSRRPACAEALKLARWGLPRSPPGCYRGGVRKRKKSSAKRAEGARRGRNLSGEPVRFCRQTSSPVRSMCSQPKGDKDRSRPSSEAGFRRRQARTARARHTVFQSTRAAVIRFEPPARWRGCSKRRSRGSPGR